MQIKKGLEKAFEEFKYTNSRNNYSKAVVDYMIRWADLMEQELTITKEKAEQLSNQADTEGITGLMYDLARNFMFKYWDKGDELKDLLGDKMTSMITIRRTQ